ncbi:hypothetical protein TARUN_6115 [Trichoderma arundinaceum]|uniref:Sfi1 spindle body domain-containing protein n=1 Tax=Trichoderma arundinaceum TaxID=490622 RepID=A0A395NJZ5_TRIAR|nr:hypothetical protein TARUN_6115 [Trichoderma arundinaceum]
MFRLDVRVSPSRVLPGQEPYYSNRDIAVLHAVIAAAQEQLDHATGPKPLPAAALFKAYDEVLPQHGVDPDSDHHLSALVFRVGGEQGGGNLLDKFQSILGRIGIVLEFSDDSVTSPQGYPEPQHPLSPEPIDTGRWYPDDLPIKEDDAPFRMPPRRYSAISSENDSPPKKIQTQEPSIKNTYEVKDDLAHVEAEAYPSAQISTTATRHLDQYHQYPSPLFDHLPVDFQIMSTGAPDDDDGVKVRLLAPQNDISQQSSNYKSKRNAPALETDELPGPVADLEQSQPSDAGDDKKASQMPVIQGKRRNTPANMIEVHQNNIQTEGVDVPASPGYLTKDERQASHLIQDSLPQVFFSNNENTLSRQQQEQLLTRATRAREIYLASKVFNHWADRTAARLEREGVARRHMIRFRCFQGWTCAPSLRFPVIDQLKALTAVQKLQRAVSYQEEQLCLAASAISQSYRARTASRVYDKWCSHFITLACRQKANKRLKQNALLAWKSSTSSNIVKSQAIHKFKTREGVINTLSKLQDQAYTNSHQLHTARQIGSLQLLFGYLNEWRDQVQVRTQSSAYYTRHSTAAVNRAFHNWNLLFIVTTQTLPIMDTAVEIRRSQMKDMIRRYLMMRYTQVSSVRKKRKFYEAFDHWRDMTAQATSETDVVAVYQTKYYYSQLDIALAKWKRQTEDNLQVQLATYKHYAQALLTTWGDIAKERDRMDIQSLELWASRRQRQYLKAWSISSLQRSGQAHTATRVQQKNYGEKRNRAFQHWKQVCTGLDAVRSEQDLRFTPKSELPSGRRSGWRALSVRRHLLMERHNKQDAAARQIETPTRWTGMPLNMSFPLLTKPIVSWRGTDEESITSSDTEDGGMLKSPSKAPATTGRSTLPSTTPRGPVPVHLNIKAIRPESSPHRWSNENMASKLKPGLTRDSLRGPQPTPKSNSSRSVAGFGRSIQASTNPNARSATSSKQMKAGSLLLKEERGSRVGQLSDLPTDNQNSNNYEADMQSFQIS